MHTQTPRKGESGMDFYAILDQVVALLRQRQRVTYRALKRQFALDDDALADLTAELLYAHPQVRDDAGQGLLWTGEPAPAPAAAPSVVEPAQPAPLGPRSSDRPLYAFRGGLSGAGASSTDSKIAANIERGF
jgi:hypothetical protein